MGYIKAAKETRGTRIYGCKKMIHPSGALIRLNCCKIFWSTPSQDLNVPPHPTIDDLFLRTGFLDSGISYVGTSNNPFQGI